jgi:hypothetical protein
MWAACENLAGKMAVSPDIYDRLTYVDPFDEFFLGLGLMGINLDSSKGPQFLLCFRPRDGRGKIIRNNDVMLHIGFPLSFTGTPRIPP